MSGARVTPRGRFPLVKVANGFVFVSGTSARRPDNSIAGAAADELGTTTLDIRTQTRAVIENLRELLQGAGARLADLVQVTTYLVNMNDFGGYNEVWAEYFDERGPTRTTVAVHQLPHPHLLLEMQAVAALPEGGKDEHGSDATYQLSAMDRGEPAPAQAAGRQQTGVPDRG